MEKNCGHKNDHEPLCSPLETFFEQGFDVSDKDAFKKLEELEKTLKIERELKQRMADRSARAFFKQFGKMVDDCDVIIQVWMSLVS